MLHPTFAGFEENMKTKDKIKILIILGVEFVAIAIILVMIFFAGKKTHTVTFDLDGGILLSGDVEQRVTQGHNATPPSVTKDGHFLRGWSGSYREITHDVTIKAIWEYETSPGIIYSNTSEGIDANYCEIIGSYENLVGDIYVGAYHNEKIVFGIKEGAFANRNSITAIYMLNGILDIADNAFYSCDELTEIILPASARNIGSYALYDCKKLTTAVLPTELVKLGSFALANCEMITELNLPDTLESIGSYAFMNLKEIKEIVIPEGVTEIPEGAFLGCSSLESIVLPEGLVSIGKNAFSGCESLKEIHIPESVTDIAAGAFDTEEIKITTPIEGGERPQGWLDNAFPSDREFVWEFIPEPPENAKIESDSDKNDNYGKANRKIG